MEDMAEESVKFVLKSTAMEQKQLHLEAMQDMLDCTNSDTDFLNTVIIGTES